MSLSLREFRPRCDKLSLREFRLRCDEESAGRYEIIARSAIP